MANTRVDDFQWVDARGNSVGRDADLRAIPGGDPYAYLTTLVDRHRDSAGHMGPTGRDAVVYSWLLNRLAAKGSIHTHMPRAEDLPIWTGPVPEHCGWPAWLRPSGWRCRHCGIPFPDADNPGAAST